MTEWTFLTNHALVLLHIAYHPMTTAREISTYVGITERAISKLISNLDEEGYITKKKVGRRIHYSINPELLLRHDNVREIAVGDFLKVLDWKNRALPETTNSTTNEMKS